MKKNGNKYLPSRTILHVNKLKVSIKNTDG